MFANPFSRIVINKNGSVRNLTAKEFDLLYYLFINKGQVFTNEQIYDHVWEHDAGFNPRSLSSFICRLRKKVEPNPKQPIYILTVRGVGYKFNDEGAIG